MIVCIKYWDPRRSRESFGARFSGVGRGVGRNIIDFARGKTFAGLPLFFLFFGGSVFEERGALLAACSPNFSPLVTL